ncbi:MAG: hypothetical protein K0V04_33120 [Deltaproteobacteria bacterium]|nr:hypothetical protein [Deltaproteobacteria bacterium]
MRASSTFVVCLSLLPACVLDSTDTLDERGLRPFRDQWRVELDATVALDGPGALDELLIGGTTFESNFSNRGDVIVQFHDEARVIVEMRRFTHALSSQSAAEEFEDLALWAFLGGDVAPMRPEQMQFPRPCIGAAGNFLDGCGLRVYHRGNAQPLRAGADVRVTLPAAYRGEINVITEDMITDSNYLNRGNVCIEPTQAKVEVTAQRGVIFGSVSEQGGSISALGDAAEIWLDVPAALRTQVSVSYEDDSDKTERCYGDVEIAGFVATGGSFGATHGSFSGYAGPEAEPTVFDATVSGIAKVCDVVAFTESPDQFNRDAAAQASETRGVPHVCNDCLRDRGCDELLAEI